MKSIIKNKQQNYELLKYNNFYVFLINTQTKTTFVSSYLNHGMADETKTNAGISHLLEHISTDGWDKCKESCTDYWKKHGTSMNAWTFQTGVGYHINGLNEFQYKMVDYIVSISCDPKIKNSRVIKEKKAVHQELLNHKSDPQYDLYNLANKNIFSLEGMQLQDNCDSNINNLNKLNVKMLESWKEKYYGSGNTIFVISGSFSSNKMKAFIKKKLSNYPIKCTVKAHTHFFKPGFKLDYTKNKASEYSTIFLSFYNNYNLGNINYYKILFLDALLNRGSSASILMYELREKRSLIYNCKFYTFDTAYGTQILIEIQCFHKNIKPILKTSIDVFNKIKNNSFDNTIFKSVKNVILTDTYEKCMNNNTVADFYGHQIINQIHEKDIKIFDRKMLIEFMNNITKKDISDFAKETLNYSNLKITYSSTSQISGLENFVKNLLK